MPTIDLANVNYWAVLVSAVATFFLGAIWYGPLFGQRWIKLHGWSDAQVAEMKAKMNPPVFFGVMLVSYFVLALVIAVLFQITHVSSAAGGALLGVVLWIAPTAAVTATQHVASNKPWGLYLIDSGNQLVYLVMIGAIVGAWR